MPTALSRSDGVWQRLCWLNVLITVCLLNTVGAVWHIMRPKSGILYIRLEPRHGALDLRSIHKFPCFPCLQQLLGRWCRFLDPLTPSVGGATLRLPSLSTWTTGSARGSRPLLWCCLHAMQMIGKQTAPHRATRSPRPSLQPMQISAHHALGSREAGN